MTIKAKNTQVTFRSKFRKCLNDENLPSITELFERFFKVNSNEARKILWKMTITEPENALCKVYEDLGIEGEVVPFNTIALLRNEMRYQYETMRPYFLVMEIPEECQEAFRVLQNRSDAITAFEVYTRCMLRMGNTDMERILYLLRSPKEENYFGGIRSLNFDWQEANFLKPLHMEIHDLLQAMCNEGYQQDTAKESLMECVTENPKLQESAEFTLLTPEAILEHKELFKALVFENDLKALSKLRELKFDLNEVMSKKEKIFNLLSAMEAF